MNRFPLYITLAVASSAALLSSCGDENNIGSSITKGEVTIEVDSLFSVSGRAIQDAQFDSRSLELLIGRLSAEGYGELEAGFASRLMPASTLPIPDSIPLDSVKSMVLRFRYHSNAFTGDSLAPQQLSVYRLTRQLPDDIDNTTDLTGYYDESAPMGSRSYTVTALGTVNSQKGTRSIDVPLSPEYAREVIRQYRTDPSVFQWASSFAEVFPGIVVKSTFGRGLVANISNTEFVTYYNTPARTTVIVDGVGVARDTLRRDSASLFAITPEVLSANIMRLRPSQNIVSRVAAGECILMSPGGYNVQIDFPAQQIVERYLNDNFNLGVINTLTYTVPAQTIANTYNIAPPPYLLMVKSHKAREFFASNSLPEENDKEVFWAAYDADKKQYMFSNMRPYIIDLMQRNTPITEEDTQFTLVPVSITTETAGSSYNPRTIVTKCQYYIAHPSMCLLDIPASKVKFTYSRQVIK